MKSVSKTKIDVQVTVKRTQQTLNESAKKGV